MGIFYVIHNMRFFAFKKIKFKTFKANIESYAIVGNNPKTSPAIYLVFPKCSILYAIVQYHNQNIDPHIIRTQDIFTIIRDLSCPFVSYIYCLPYSVPSSGNYYSVLPFYNIVALRKLCNGITSCIITLWNYVL